MAMDPAESENDPALLPFLTATDRGQSEASLSQLISEQTESTIREIIRRKLRVSLSSSDGSYPNQEALELTAEVQAALLGALRELKNNPGAKAIANFQSYVATVTFNACHHSLRRKYPKRLQLKNRLRYLLTHEPRFALWESDERDWLCGLASWRGAKRMPDTGSRLQQLRDQRERFSHAVMSDNSRQGLIELLNSAFQKLNSAVLLDELVTVLSDLLQIKEDVAVDIQSREHDEPKHLTAGASISTELEQRAQLQNLWAEICQLPLRHRVALLLNLRDKNGADTLALFPLTRVATIREIAEVVGFDHERFARVWNELPWDDATIARHLELTRQQVINLRQSARARLARRVRQL